MVKIPNKQITIAGKAMKYSKMLRQLLDNPPMQGWTMKEVKSVVKLDGPLSTAKNEILIEDEDFKVLVNIFDKTQWAFASKELVELDHILHNLLKP